MRTRRLLGVPFLYSAASAAVGFSMYFSIGVVADRGLGLTPLIFLVYVAELPLTGPHDAPLTKEVQEGAEKALERAREVGDEYENVEVTTKLVPARSIGSGIIDEARGKDVEVIVMGGELPTRIRGGAVLGGIGGARPDEIGEVTEYVLKRAPCRVLLTAPPEE
jgi:APA family basic amino acid/polyamine antiporter